MCYFELHYRNPHQAPPESACFLIAEGPVLGYQKEVQEQRQTAKTIRYLA